MLDLQPFLCGACGCPYNDLVICKDSSDCLEISKLKTFNTCLQKKNIAWESLKNCRTGVR